MALVALIASIPIAPRAWAESARAKNKAGLYASFHGDPAPSVLGGNYAYNLSDFLRLNAGVGGYHDWMGRNLGAGFANYVARPMLYGIVYSLVWLFTAGNVKLRYSKFANKVGEVGYHDTSLFTYGGGAKLLIPGMNLSPVIGAGFAGYASSGHPYGLENSGSALSFTGGLDWTDVSGFNVGAGYNYCPAVSNGGCGVYVNLGFFF